MTLFSQLKSRLGASLRQQLVLLFSLLSTIMIMSAGYALFTYQKNFLYQQANEHAISVANTLALNSWSKVLTEDLAELNDYLTATMQAKDVVSAHIISLQGDLLASMPPISNQSQQLSRQVSQLKLEQYLLVDRNDVVEVIAPIKAGHHVIGWVALTLSRDDAHANLRVIAVVGFCIAIVFALITSMIAYRFAHHLTQDIEHLVRLASSAQLGQAFARIETNRADEIGRLTQALYVMIDTIELEGQRRKQKAYLLSQERDFMAAVLNNIGALVVVINREAEIVRFNRAAEVFTGYTFEEVKHKPYFWSQFLTSEQRPKVHALFENIKQGNVKPYFENDWLSRDGQQHPFAWSNTIMLDDKGDMAFLVTIGNDISEQKAHEKELEHIAHYDALTHLPNRSLLLRRLQEIIEEAHGSNQLFAVVFIDLDGFKLVNDTFGHDVGDQLLIALSGRMAHLIKESDTLSRMGGDEFVAILTHLPNTDACIPIIERLLKATSEPVYYHSLSLQVSASIGISVCEQATQCLRDQLLQQADHAMYQAKLSGKNRYVLFT